MNDRTKVAAAVIHRRGKILIARRKKGDRFEGRWEFPGGKIEAGESPEECLRRELREEMEVDIEAEEYLGSVLFETSGLSIELMAFRASLLSGKTRCHDHDEIRWIDPDDLGDFDLAEPDRLIARVRFSLESPGRESERTGVMTDKTAVLRKGKDKPIRNRHHWIFSGAVESLPDGLIDGGMYPVLSHERSLLGYAYFNRKCSIIGRMVSFGPGDPFNALRKNVQRAIALRNESIVDGQETNACRLINAEGDGIPGLIVDKYDTTLVIQITTLGMEMLRDFIVEMLVQELGPASIYEKSILPSRREEGLGDKAGFLTGGQVTKIFIRENGFNFLVDIAESQKTGFYLDQREMRKLAGSLAANRRVLNCFSYTGGYSVYALLGGAVRVDSVDTSGPALEMAKQNLRLNGLSPEEHGFIEADVFSFLRGPVSGYDLIILDPPAFAKRKTDVLQAGRGYKDINRLALQKVSAGGYVLTFSCSHFVDEPLFQKIVFEAAVEASRNVRILQRHRQAFDHPVNIFHPETEYLKGFLLYVD